MVTDRCLPQHVLPPYSYDMFSIIDGKWGGADYAVATATINQGFNGLQDNVNHYTLGRGCGD